MRPGGERLPATIISSVIYRRSGHSGLLLPALSVGLWQRFGGDQPSEENRAIIRRAFEQGVTHFDLANNYGPPYGAAETNFGRMLRTDLAGHRDELVISSKAGWDMWPGPYGNWGSRKYLLASLDQSLARIGVDYVDIFYHHRPDPETPLEETMGALATAVHSGKALSQMGLAWVLRDTRVTSAITGVSSVRQLEENLAALDHLEFSADELSEIDSATA